MLLKELTQIIMPPAFRNDQDYKAGFVRVAIGVFMSFYLGIGTMAGYFSISTYGFTVMLSSFMLYSISVFIWVLKRPGNIPRRYIVNFIDILYVTISSMLVGLSDSPFYLIYILIFISQGGRFGRPYLFAAAFMSLISYSFLCFIDPDFSMHALESSFKLIALIVLPIYLDAMLKTIQRAKHDADAANESKSRFLATMSHEIRTPMSGAVGMINLLKTTELDNEQKIYVDGLSTSTSRLHMLINDILDFSKIEAGKLTLETHPFNIEESLNDVNMMLGPMAKQSDIEFTFNISDDVPKTLLGDSFRLCQILLNLAGNAIKFTENGEVKINVSKHNTNVYFEISDTGIGIDEEHLKHIFDGFTQADSSTTRRFGGTGLGTTIARELVKLMKGHIGVRSVVGEGSTFWFEVPLPSAMLSDISESIEDKKIQPVKKSSTPALQVLLAEDSEINVLFMSTILKQAGHKVDVVGNGELAYQILLDNHYDIVFMDMHMPIMDGVTATEKWREEETIRADNKKKVPIIALTANVSDDDRLRCLNAGMNEFLSKPVSPERLEEILSIFCSDISKETQ